MRALLDTSAIQDLIAIKGRDNSIHHTSLGWLTLCTSQYMAHEVFYRLSENPFDARSTRDSRFLLDHWPIAIVKPATVGIADELAGTHLLDLGEPFVSGLRRMLSNASLGQFDTSLRRDRDFNESLNSIGSALLESAIQEAALSLPTPPADFHHFLTTSERIEFAVHLLRNFARPPYPAPSSTLNAGRQAILAPRTHPYCASFVRTTLFNWWNSLRNGKTGQVKDLNHLQIALSVDAVISRDKNLLKRGVQIFPEVQWVDSRTL